jgi:hypothetical protein
MVAAGVTVHYLYALLGILPTARPALAEMGKFSIDYTFWLNLAFAAVALGLLWLHFANRPRGAARAEEGARG